MARPEHGEVHLGVLEELVVEDEPKEGVGRLWQHSGRGKREEEGVTGSAKAQGLVRGEVEGTVEAKGRSSGEVQGARGSCPCGKSGRLVLGRVGSMTLPMERLLRLSRFWL